MIIKPGKRNEDIIPKGELEKEKILGCHDGRVFPVIEWKSDVPWSDSDATPLKDIQDYIEQMKEAESRLHPEPRYVHQIPTLDNMTRELQLIKMDFLPFGIQFVAVFSTSSGWPIRFALWILKRCRKKYGTQIIEV